MSALLRLAWASLANRRFTVAVTVAAPPTPVPANATWALGLLGMSLLGFGARRMRRNAQQ